MHVAYIHQHFNTTRDHGGTRSYEMSKRLLYAGHKVTMISGISDAARHRIDIRSDKSEAVVDGINVIYINIPYQSSLHFWQRVAVFRRFARQAETVAIDSDADLVLASSTPLTVGLPGMRAARRLGVPFVFEIRDPWPELPIEMGIIRNPLLKWYLRRLERKLYHAADHCIALSPGMRDGIIGTGYPEHQVSMIPNSSDVDLFRPTRNDETPHPSVDERDCTFIYSGAHGYCNNLDAVIDAALELKRRGEQHIRFYCIGDGVLKDQHIQRTQREGLGDYLEWLDPIPKVELAQRLSTFDVGMMLLGNHRIFRYGTSPNKFFDYIAAGLPVLNNYGGWLADMICEHEIGKAILPDTPAAFADACVWFRDHRVQREEMGERSRTLAVNQFSRDRLGTEFVHLLENVAATTTPELAAADV